MVKGPLFIEQLGSGTPHGAQEGWVGGMQTQPHHHVPNLTTNAGSAA